MEQLILLLLSIPLGIVIGALDTVFGKTLLLVSDVRAAHPYLLIPFLAVAGLGIVFAYAKSGGKSGRGMALIFAAGHGEEDDVPLILVPLVAVTTWITHLFGGSAGREGVAVQIGATVSHWVGRKLPYADAPRLLLTAGMAAGFAGLFRTPMAAALFALEVLTAGRLNVRALLPTVAAAFTAAQTSKLLGLEKFEVLLTGTPAFDAGFVGKLLLLALAFGLTGLLFSSLLRRTKAFLADRMPNPYKRIAIVGAALSVVLLLLYGGRYSGLGTNLISASLTGGQIYPRDWALKLLLTVLTLAAGYQGGEVTPLFSIGAALGVFLASLLNVPLPLAAALGYIAVFGSATNTLLAPIFIGMEVFGPANFPCYFIVCATAYALNRNRSIYSGQKVLPG